MWPCLSSGGETWTRRVALGPLAEAPNVHPTGEQNFIKSLIHFDKDNISDKVLKKIGAYCAQPDFQPDIIGRVSSAAKSLCMWVRAMEVSSGGGGVGSREAGLGRGRCTQEKAGGVEDPGGQDGSPAGEWVGGQATLQPGCLPAAVWAAVSGGGAQADPNECCVGPASGEASSTG